MHVPDNCEGILRPATNHFHHQLEIEPVGDGAKVSDHWPGKLGKSRARRRITEEVEIGGVGNQMRGNPAGGMPFVQRA